MAPEYNDAIGYRYPGIGQELALGLVGVFGHPGRFGELRRPLADLVIEILGQSLQRSV